MLAMLSLSRPKTERGSSTHAAAQVATSPTKQGSPSTAEGAFNSGIVKESKSTEALAAESALARPDISYQELNTSFLNLDSVSPKNSVINNLLFRLKRKCRDVAKKEAKAALENKDISWQDLNTSFLNLDAVSLKNPEINNYN